MLKGIRDFFEAHMAATDVDGAGETEQALRLAVAVLLIEVAESDYQDHPDEQQMLLHSVRTSFGLDGDEADELIKLAREEHASSTDYFQFTRLINSHFSQQRKIGLLECLWRVAFADNQLHHYEEHVIRRLAELIHLPHSDFIAAKLRVKPEA